MGDYDFVKVVLERLAAERPASTYAWMQIAIKPAKPLAFAAIGGVPVFGLPGQPGVVTRELRAARPARRCGGSPADPTCCAEPVIAVAASDLRRRPDGRVHFDRVRRALRGGPVRVRAGRACRRATCSRAWRPRPGLAILEDGDGVEAGDPVPVLLL